MSHTNPSPAQGHSAPAIRSPLSNKSNVDLDSLTAATWDYKDSSESQPSAHGSLYDAAWVPKSDLPKSPYRTPAPVAVSVMRPSTPIAQQTVVDPNSESPLSRLEQTPFLYGYGTELGPIIEQRSISTLRTKASLSTSDLSSLMHGGPGANGMQHRLRRQQSFSLDDLSTSVKKRNNGGNFAARSGSPCLSPLSSSSPPQLQEVNIYAYPQMPPYPRYEGPEIPFHFRGQRSGHGTLTNHPFLRHHSPRKTGSPGASEGIPQRRLRRLETSAAATTDSSLRNRSELSSSAIHEPTTATGDVYPPHPPRHGSGRYQPLSQLHLDGEDSSDDNAGWRCKACRRPADQWWSLYSTIVGHGSGMRRGDEWCTRCALRRVARLWCCCKEHGA
ncbi:hypothetical protein F4778DRAFT_188130 [Xylariomycetidae sp. FL2044]|nr:hypothetical protein F4778DRAFT_188130 [Xylariomycetidae sp. FL2044]